MVLCVGRPGASTAGLWSLLWKGKEGRALSCASGRLVAGPVTPLALSAASLVVLADTRTSLPWEVPEVENLSKNLQENNNKMSLRVRINELNMCGLYF